MRKAQGFTLIELLVAIGIIALLAAMVFPVLSRAREKGRQTQCLSNLRQLGIAMRMYADDWDGHLPAARVADEGGGNAATNWAGVDRVNGWCDPAKGQIYPYIRDRGVYLCPSVRGVKPARITAHEALPYPLSYSMNVMLDRRDPDQCAAPVGRMGLLVQEDVSTLDDGDFNWPGWAGLFGGHNEPSSVHNGGTCVLYCDMHAKWQGYYALLQDLADAKWHPYRP